MSDNQSEAKSSSKGDVTSIRSLGSTKQSIKKALEAKRDFGRSIAQMQEINKELDELGTLEVFNRPVRVVQKKVLPPPPA